jgi:CDP-glucose 4,6-dehydratase
MLNFWKDKKVLITGINGFVGGNLAKKLTTLGANIFGLVRIRNRKSLLFFEKIDRSISLFYGDINDKELLIKIITEQKIDIIYHLAAQVEVQTALINPYLTFDSNIRGTYTILDAAHLSRHKIKAIIFASSDKSYGSYSDKFLPYKESYDLRPKYPYEVSKACGDLIAKCYSIKPYYLPIVICRFANIYGPGQLNFSALVPNLMQTYYGYSNFVPRSNGLQIRDYIFVDDVIDLYLTIAKELYLKPKKLSGQIFNCGNNKKINARKVVKIIFYKHKKNKLLKILKLMKNRKAIGEINKQYMDYKKVYKFFKWKPKTNFQDGIEKAKNWYQNYLKKIHF